MPNELQLSRVPNRGAYVPPTPSALADPPTQVALSAIAANVASWSVPLNAAVPVDSLLVVQMAGNSSGGPVLTDSKGNNYANLSVSTSRGATLSSGFWVSRISSALATTDTLNFTVTGGVGYRLVKAYRFDGLFDMTSSVLNFQSNASSSGTSLSVGAPSVEVPGLLLANASWSKTTSYTNGGVPVLTGTPSNFAVDTVTGSGTTGMFFGWAQVDPGVAATVNLSSPNTMNAVSVFTAILRRSAA